MKLSLHFLTISLLLATTPCHAQTELFDVVWKDLKKIEKSSKDPVILVGPESSPFGISFISIGSDSTIISWEWYYVLYKEGNKNQLVKYVELLQPHNGKKFYQSQPIRFTNDTLFTWLSFQERNISAEDVLPFIYLDTVNNTTAYRQGFLMHTTPFDLTVHFPTEAEISFDPHFKFDEIAMQPSLMPGDMNYPVNLNYEYNRRLKIFQLYTMMKTVLSNKSLKFTFR